MAGLDIDTLTEKDFSERELSALGRLANSLGKLTGLLREENKGGPGSGHHGHVGRPGKRGGSAPGHGPSFSPDAARDARRAEGHYDVVSETDTEGAKKLLTQGIEPTFKPDIPGPSSYAPGRGLEREGLYVANEEAFSRGSFGRIRLYLTVNEDDLGVPQEMAQIGHQDVNTVLGTENGAVTVGALPKSVFSAVDVYDGERWERMSPAKFLKSAGVSPDFPKLPTVPQYRRWLESNANRLMLSQDKIDRSVHDYNRSSLEEMLVLAQEAGLVDEKSLDSKGGPGSGYHDHPGRPGQRGGSAPSWAGSESKIVDGLTVYNGKYGVVKNQWSVSGERPYWEDTPEKAVRTFREREREHARAESAEEWGREAVRKIVEGDDKPFSRMASPKMNITRAEVLLTGLGVPAKEAERIVSRMHIVGTNAWGGELRSRDELLEEFRNWQKREGIKGGPGSGHHEHTGRPGQRGGSQPGSGLQDILPQHEETERALVTRKTEKSVCFDSEGNIIFQKSGTAKKIKYTADDIETMTGAAVHYHNHPSVEQAPTTSFSPDDLTAAAELRVGESRVVSGRYRYRIVGSPENLRKMAVEGDLDARPHLSAARYYSRVRKWDKAREAADKYNDWHSRWAALADKYDVLYVREEL